MATIKIAFKFDVPKVTQIAGIAHANSVTFLKKFKYVLISTLS